MGTVDLIRVETVHAFIVHFALGAVAPLLLGYGAAAWRGSERWTFFGDVTVVIAAAAALAAVTSGLLANSVLRWPGGLGRWRDLHLTLAVVTTLLLAALAIARLVFSGPRAPAGKKTLAAAAVASLGVLATAWIGGEVLVVHAGMAVKGAGEGALAPPARLREEPTADLHDSMGKVRGEWASIVTVFGSMLVHRPTPEGFAEVAHAARSLEKHARWLQDEGAREIEQRGQPPRQLAFMAGLLEERSHAVTEAATGEDLSELSRTIGDLGTSCAGCHETFRWDGMQ